jgi:hypothetical protein
MADVEAAAGRKAAAGWQGGGRLAGRRQAGKAAARRPGNQQGNSGTGGEGLPAKKMKGSTASMGLEISSASSSL